MRLGNFCILLLSAVLLSTVSAFTEKPLENVAATEQTPVNVITLSVEEPGRSGEAQPAEQLLAETVEPQGHENAGERKARQFGFGFPPPPPPPPFYGGGFGGGFGGSFGGGYGGGFQRTRVVTRTRVVNRVRGGGFYGGGGGYFG